MAGMKGLKMITGIGVKFLLFFSWVEFVFLKEQQTLSPFRLLFPDRLIHAMAAVSLLDCVWEIKIPFPPTVLTRTTTKYITVFRFNVKIDPAEGIAI